MVKLPNASSLTLQGDRSPTTRQLLAWENQTYLDTFLVALFDVLVARLFAGRPRFQLKGLMGLIVGLAINSTVSIAGKVAVGLSGQSL